MLGSHNSLSGYPVKHILLKPFNFISKCQSKTLEEQYLSGVRSFDLRFAKYAGEWYGAHGMMLYTIDLYTTLELLSKLSTEKDPVYFRVIVEDTFFKKSEAEGLALLIEKWLYDHHTTLIPLYIRSKRTWRLVRVYEGDKSWINYDTNSLTENDRDSLCLKVSQMYELQTSNDKLNFIGCYESAGIPLLLGLPYPKLAANSLTPIALKKNWKKNDVPVVDFI